MKEGIIIRPAEQEMVDAIGELQARSIMAFGSKTYDQATCEAWARMGRQVRHTLLDSGIFFIAKRAGRLVGVAGWAADSREADCAWPRYVFVAPEAARLGVGLHLMTAVEQSAHAAGRTRLQLWASLNALGFYQALGYRSIRPVYWPLGRGVDMTFHLMTKTRADISKNND